MARDQVDLLIARAQEGDVRAFEMVLESHLPTIRRFARAFAANESEADDLAQEALVRVYRNICSFRYQAAFSSWLYAIVRSAYLDANKGRSGRRRELEEEYRDSHGEREGGSRPDEAVLAEEDRQRVWSALREIPAEFRTAVVLFDIEGLTYDEVASIEGVAVGTVKSRLHRGRAALKKLLEDTSAKKGTFDKGAASHDGSSR